MIDAILATSFDCHHPFPSSSPAPTPPSTLPLVSHTRTQVSGSNSIQHAGKINVRQKETDQRGDRGEEIRLSGGATHFWTALSRSVILSTSILRRSNGQKFQHPPNTPVFLSFHCISCYITAKVKITPVDVRLP